MTRVESVALAIAIVSRAAFDPSAPSPFGAIRKVTKRNLKYDNPRHCSVNTYIYILFAYEYDAGT